MAEKTKIEWADSTLNPWLGCTKISPACDNCYAEKMDARGIFGGQHWGPGVPRKRTSEANWRQPLRWNMEDRLFRECPSCRWRGEEHMCPMEIGRTAKLCPLCRTATMPARRRVFCASLADVFDNEVPAEWRADLFRLIAQTPNLDWLVLTKRVGNVARMVEAIAESPRIGSHEGHLMAHQWRKGNPPKNVLLGATICNQEEADRDIPKLLAVPAAVRFVSMEPLLGPVDLRFGDSEGLPTDAEPFRERHHLLHWVISGGESGPNARPTHPEWLRSLRDQCAAAGVPFNFKQWGEWTPGENVVRQHGTVDTAKWWNDAWSFHDENLASTDGHIDDEPDLYLVGKKAAGRLLDGVEHNEFPEVQP